MYDVLRIVCASIDSINPPCDQIALSHFHLDLYQCAHSPISSHPQPWSCISKNEGPVVLIQETLVFRSLVMSCFFLHRHDPQQNIDEMLHICYGSALNSLHTSAFVLPINLTKIVIHWRKKKKKKRHGDSIPWFSWISSRIGCDGQKVEGFY